jgi:cysteine-rich repeat protein
METARRLAVLAASVALTLLLSSGSAFALICGDSILDPGEQCDDGNLVAGDCCSPLCQFEADNSPCNDNDACTQTDTCQTGICTGANPVVCTALDQCHAVGICSPGTGV